MERLGRGEDNINRRGQHMEIASVHLVIIAHALGMRIGSACATSWRFGSIALPERSPDSGSGFPSVPRAHRYHWLI